jgi:hypothetical protein
VADDAEHNPVAAGRVGEAGHRPGPAPHFAEGAFDHIWWCALSSGEAAGTAKKLSNSSKSRSTESKRVSSLPRPGVRIYSQNEAIKQPRPTSLWSCQNGCLSRYTSLSRMRLVFRTAHCGDTLPDHKRNHSECRHRVSPPPPLPSV